jgi:hypothetical protein
MKTIESEIYEAFAKAGAILQANASDPIKVLPAWRFDLIDRVASNEPHVQIRVFMPPET